MKKKYRSQTPEYIAWQGMIARCTQTHSNSYHRYGGRGIKVCDRWLVSFENFLSDMGMKPSPSHSIDRIENSGNYEPGNCRWATAKEQARNRRSSHLLEFNGKRQPIAKWAEETGINAPVISMRIVRLKWSVEKTLTTPVMSYRESGRIGLIKRYGHE